jgi:hypothetical protein
MSSLYASRDETTNAALGGSSEETRWEEAGWGRDAGVDVVASDESESTSVNYS